MREVAVSISDLRRCAVHCMAHYGDGGSHTFCLAAPSGRLAVKRTAPAYRRLLLTKVDFRKLALLAFCLTRPQLNSGVKAHARFLNRPPHVQPDVDGA